MLVTLALSLSLLYCSFSQALDETQQWSPLEGAVQTRKRVKIHESGEEGRGRAPVTVRELKSRVKKIVGVKGHVET